MEKKTNKKGKKTTNEQEAIFTTKDGFSNLASGMGGSNDKSMYATFNPTFNYASRHFYGWMYRDDWICQSIIDTPVDDASAKGRTHKKQNSRGLRFIRGTL